MAILRGRVVLVCYLWWHVFSHQEAKSKQKQLKRRAMGLDGIATDVIESDELFSLSVRSQVKHGVFSSLI